MKTGILVFARAVVRAGMRRELEIGLLVGVEVRIDRIVGDDSRQHAACSRPDCRRDQRARDAAVDRRAHLGELEVQARRFQRRRGGADVVGAGAGGRGELIEILLRDHVLARPAACRGRGSIAASSDCERARAVARLSRFTSAWNGRGSMRNSSWPFLTRAPSVNCTESMKPLTRGPDFDAVDGLQSAAEFLPVAQRLGDHARRR